MDEKRFDRRGGGPPDDLGPALRRAVEGVLRDPPPEGLTARALTAARHVGSSHSAVARPALGRRRRTAWRVLAVAASIGVAAALALWHWDGWLHKPVAVHPAPAGPGHVESAPHNPETPPAGRRSSLWAYRQAARQSEEALDEALDRDARHVFASGSQAPESWVRPDSVRQML